MAYDEFLADRIRSIFKQKGVSFFEKKMMGGLCYMVDDKMCCGVHFSKKSNQDLLMVRIGEEACNASNNEAGFLPMDFTGRPMKGYAFINSAGFDMDVDLEKWIQRCIDFNPIAKSSKRKK